MTGKLFCGMTFSLKNRGRRRTTRTRTSQTTAVSDIPVPIGDTRIFTMMISAGASIFSQFSIHCVLSGVPRWGILFSQGWSVDHRSSRCGRHLHCQRPCIDGKLFQQCVGKGPAEKNGFLPGRC
ncbi:hypothetical protein V8E54_006324 [Elaphomyces granulatus]